MPRYATIITDDDGQDVVSAIAIFEGAAPTSRTGRIEQVAAGVLIGMVRGGPVDAIGSFGFPCCGLDGRAISLARANLKAAPAKPGDAPADAAGRKATRKPVRAKRRKPAKTKSGKTKSGKVRRPAKPVAQAQPVGVPEHG